MRYRFVLPIVFVFACSPTSGDRSDASVTSDSMVVADAGVDAGPRWADTGLRPAGRFAEIWNDLGAGEGELGYPVAGELASALCAWQPFQTGLMLWVESRVIADTCQEFCDLARIFSVVFPGGDPAALAGETHHEHPDDWADPMPELSCPEADPTLASVGGETKAIGPIRGFGLIWCSYPTVQADIGAATAPERGGAAFLDCESQLFQGGLIVHNPNAEDASYWVFLGDRSWQRVPE